ncbi:MAG: AbrB/MazE/SpoVT family DNA-binding domain-containing protein [Spirochaetales bacterium]|nr:AbrB/MazE/SpoVT family DNA-binding domain-containing protein [Spirochaetales bacterium]
MQKKLVKHGNSAALVLDKPILELLHIDMETPLELRTDGHSLTITPVQTERELAVRKAIRKVTRNHGKTLKKLAQ